MPSDTLAPQPDSDELLTLLRTTADSAADGIVILEEKRGVFSIVYVNDSVLTQTGYTRLELLGRPFTSFVSPACMYASSPSIQQLLIRGAPVRVEVLLRHASGSHSPCDVHLRPLPSAGGSAHWVVSLCHTASPEPPGLSHMAEPWYHLLFESQSRPMWLYDEETFRFLEVNRAAVNTYGYSRDEFLKMTILEIRPKEDVSLFRAFAVRRRSLGQNLPAIWRHRRKDGSTFLVEAHSRDVEINGRRLRLVETADVSERREIEDQIRQSQKMEAVGQLAGGISHDFNNLLTVINGYSSMLVDRLAADHPMREELMAIRRSGERAAALTRQLLAFSRKQVLKPAILNLNGLILDMRSMLERVIREDIELITDLDADLDTTFADPTQMEQVVMNLVINARDAISGHGTITIQTRNVSADDAQCSENWEGPLCARVKLTVRDTGCGMDEAVLSHLFEPFYTTKEKGRGTGLGLPTVYGIIKQSGGEIEVESKPGIGTAFDIYLKGALGEQELRKVTVPEPSREPGTGTILLVEDDEAVREFIECALEHFGYEVITAQDGQQAVEIAVAFDRPIDLLISDIVMPKMNGYDVARRLAEKRRGMKVLFLSGYAEDTYAGHPAGIEAHLLPKPFTPGELGRKVRDLIPA